MRLNDLVEHTIATVCLPSLPAAGKVKESDRMHIESVNSLHSFSSQQSSIDGIIYWIPAALSWWSVQSSCQNLYPRFSRFPTVDFGWQAEIPLLKQFHQGKQPFIITIAPYFAVCMRFFHCKHDDIGFFVSSNFVRVMSALVIAEVRQWVNIANLRLPRQLSFHCRIASAMTGLT